MIKNLKNLT